MYKFFKEFRNDHRQIRDLIMDSIAAINDNNLGEAKVLLNKLDMVTGPHFRFEEEALYPRLVTIYGAGYINKLYTDHDLAIARVGRLRCIINKTKLNEDESEIVISLFRGLLPHLSDCEGLTIMLELLDGKRMEKIYKAMNKSRLENIGLMDWSDKLRNRKKLSLVD